jgi:hypothetical protein
MELSEGIRKIGFRRWYERQLIEAHLFLISGFLCLIMVIASFEGFNQPMPAWEKLVRFAAVIAGSAVCLWAWRRFLLMLSLAEHVSERSVCGKCAVYGGLDLSSVGVSRAQRRSEDGEGVLPAVGVRCRKCGHEWTIE